MKLWSSLFTSAVVILGVTACAMDPQEQHEEENVGHVSQALCKTGTVCYDDGSSGTTSTIYTFSCPSVPKVKCGAHLAVSDEDTQYYNEGDYICVTGCDGSGDGYGTYYNPCPLFKIYSCTPYGYCTCH